MSAPTTALRWVILFWVLALALYLAPRLSGLSLDPAREVYGGFIGAELMVEPTAKAHEARNYALFGAWKTNAADNYQFWRAQAPAWVYPLALSFKAFGVSYATLRVTATLFGLVGLVGVVLLMHRRFGTRGALLGAVMVATETFLIYFGRSGILEPIVIGWCALGFYFLDRAFDRALWLLPAFAMLVVALATKLAALPAVPVFLLFGGIALFRGGGARLAGRTRWLVIAAVVAVLGALTVYALSPAYLRTLIWNFHHMLLNREGGTELDLDSIDDEQIGATVEQLQNRFQRLRWMFPVTLFCGGLEIGRQAYLVARRRASVRDLMLVALLVSFAVGVFVPRFSGLRFITLLALPLTLLTISFVCSAADWLSGLDFGKVPRLLGRFGPALFGLGFAIYGLAVWGYGRVRQQNDIHNAAELLREKIGDRDDAVIIGLWAAPVVFETGYKHYYVKSSFNSTPEALFALAPTHTLLLENDHTAGRLEASWPDALSRATPIATLQLRDRPLTLSHIPAVARLRLRVQLGLPLR